MTCLCICFINFAQGLSYKLLIGWHSRVVVSSLLPEISKACCIFLSTKRMYLNYLWIRVARKCNNRFKSLAKDWVILARFLSISFWPLSIILIQFHQCSGSAKSMLDFSRQRNTYIANLKRFHDYWISHFSTRQFVVIAHLHKLQQSEIACCIAY